MKNPKIFLFKNVFEDGSPVKWKRKELSCLKRKSTSCSGVLGKALKRGPRNYGCSAGCWRNSILTDQLLLAFISAMPIKYLLLVNKQGQTRLAKYYEYLDADRRVTLEGEIIRKCLGRVETQVRQVNCFCWCDVVLTLIFSVCLLSFKITKLFIADMRLCISLSESTQKKMSFQSWSSFTSL